MKRLVLSLAVVALAVQAAADDRKNPAATPTQKDPKRHEEFLADIKKMDGKIDVVFVGDSITDRWRRDGKDVWKERFEPLNAINLGIGSDCTQHVLWRLQNGELEGYHAKAFVVMIGTNNLGANTEAETAGGVKAIVDEIHKKHDKAKVLLLGIFPRHADPKNPIREKVKKTNDLLAKLDDGKTVKYLDIGAKFLEPDGSLSREIMPDAVHLSKKGYEIWADAIKKDLDELVK